jgi:hypothetical protein
MADCGNFVGVSGQYSGTLNFQKVFWQKKSLLIILHQFVILYQNMLWVSLILCLKLSINFTSKHFISLGTTTRYFQLVFTTTKNSLRLTLWGRRSSGMFKRLSFLFVFLWSYQSVVTFPTEKSRKRLRTVMAKELRLWMKVKPHENRVRASLVALVWIHSSCLLPWR